MAADIQNEIAALRQMTVHELRRQHVELFGEENRSANRQYLFRRIAWRLQALVEGDLSDRARRRAQELVRDADLRSRPPRELTIEPAPATSTATATPTMPTWASCSPTGAALVGTARAIATVTVIPIRKTWVSCWRTGARAARS